MALTTAQENVVKALAAHPNLSIFNKFMDLLTQANLDNLTMAVTDAVKTHQYAKAVDVTVAVATYNDAVLAAKTAYDNVEASMRAAMDAATSNVSLQYSGSLINAHTALVNAQNALDDQIRKQQ